MRKDYTPANPANPDTNIRINGFSEDINLATGAPNTENNYRFGLGITRGNLLPNCFMLSEANVHKGIPTFYGGDLNLSAQAAGGIANARNLNRILPENFIPHLPYINSSDRDVPNIKDPSVNEL